MTERIFIIENLEFPLDEGGKKAGNELAKYFLAEFPESYFSTCERLSGCKHYIKLPRNSPLWSPLFFLNLFKRKPDLIFYIPKGSVTFPCLIRVLVVKIICGKKVKVILLNNQPRSYSKFCQWLKLVKVPDLIITQSMSNFDNLRSVGSRTYYIPNGVNIRLFHPVSYEKKFKIRKKYGFSPEDKVLLHVGHINPNRNIHELLILLPLGFKLLVVGSTSSIQDNKYLIKLKEAGIKVFTNFIPDIQEIYQMADCYIFPVRNQIGAIESPLSVLEAMACNLPIVSTRFGSLTSMFSIEGGFLFYESAKELPQKVALALSTNIYTRLLVSRYSWDKIGAIYSKVLKDIGDE